jgi:A/G-specific adenine glycosylase
MLPEHATPQPAAPALPAPAALAELHSGLLAWFAAHGRDLPWRHTRDPYRVLVSEMMLQQTQVDRVLPKYAAFLEQFPTLAALAAAPTAEVIKAWAGLGYNRRAVNLQRIARQVHADYNGHFPRTVEELRALPGIGPYTAGALACFAFEQDVTFMDTNIRRVLRRLLLGDDPAAAPVSAAEDKTLLRVAAELVPAGQGWAWNQGLMELGALVCTKTPLCWRCPLRSQCRAYAERRRSDEGLFADAQADSMPTRPPARRVAERPAQPFVGSNRYYRGRVLAQLRSLPAGASLSLAQLGPHIKPDFSGEQDHAWLRTLVGGLARDGLAHLEDDNVRLPAT